CQSYGRPSFIFPAEDGIRAFHVTGVQTCALPICGPPFITRYPAPSRSSIIVPSSIVKWCPAPIIIRYAGITIIRHYPSAVGSIRSEERRVGKEWKYLRTTELGNNDTTEEQTKSSL